MRIIFLFIIVTVAVFFSVCAVVSAASVANPAIVLSSGEYTTGFEAGSVSGRDIKEVSTNDKTSFSSDQFLFVMDYGLLNELTFGGRFGVVGLKLDASDFDFSYGILWGLAFNGIMFDWPEQNIKVGLGLSYFDYSPENEKVAGIDVTPEAVEWVFSAEAIKELGQFNIYGGFRYSEFEIKIKDFITEEEDEEGIIPEGGFKNDLKYEQSNNFALVFGGEYQISENVYIGAELQFLDGESASLRLVYMR